MVKFIILLSAHWQFLKTPTTQTMNIYCEFLMERIRIKTNGDEIAIMIPKDFYADKMFRDANTYSKLRGFIQLHMSSLKFMERLRYRFQQNRALLLVDQAVQNHVTIRQMYNYGALFLDGRSVFIIRKPENFDSLTLENTENIRDQFVNGRLHDDTLISALRVDKGIGLPVAEEIIDEMGNNDVDDSTIPVSVAVGTKTELTNNG